MLFNILLGFIFPWIVALYWIKKDPMTFILIAPFASVVSMIINTFGYHFEFWDFTPHIPNDETISALPLDLGLYPVLSSVMVHWIHTSEKKLDILYLYLVS